MELMAWIILLGMAGGVVFSLLMLIVHRLRPGQPQFDAFARAAEAPRADVINIASVRVSGVGGLGLVAMAATLAWAIPRIGETMVLGAVLGSLLAAAMILWRRRVGPMPTSGGRFGANTMLSIDEPVRDKPVCHDDPPNGSRPHATVHLTRAAISCR